MMENGMGIQPTYNLAERNDGFGDGGGWWIWILLIFVLFGYGGYGNGNHNHGAVECDLTFREGLFRRFGDGKNNAFSRQGDKACLDLQEHSHGK